MNLQMSFRDAIINEMNDLEVSVGIKPSQRADEKTISTSKQKSPFSNNDERQLQKISQEQQSLPSFTNPVSTRLQESKQQYQKQEVNLASKENCNEKGIITGSIQRDYKIEDYMNKEYGLKEKINNFEKLKESSSNVIDCKNTQGTNLSANYKNDQKPQTTQESDIQKRAREKLAADLKAIQHQFEGNFEREKLKEEPKQRQLISSKDNFDRDRAKDDPKQKLSISSNQQYAEYRQDAYSHIKDEDFYLKYDKKQQISETKSYENKKGPESKISIKQDYKELMDLKESYLEKQKIDQAPSYDNKGKGEDQSKLDSDIQKCKQQYLQMDQKALERELELLEKQRQQQEKKERELKFLGREFELKERDFELKGSEQQFKRKESDKKERDLEYKANEQQFKRKESDYQDRDTELKGREHQFKRRELEYKERDQIDFKDRDTKFKESEQQIKKKEPEYKERDLLYKGRDIDYKGRDIDYKGREQEFQVKDQLLQQAREQEYLERQQEFKRREEELQRCEEELKLREKQLQGKQQFMKEKQPEFKGRETEFKGIEQSYQEANINQQKFTQENTEKPQQPDQYKFFFRKNIRESFGGYLGDEGNIPDQFQQFCKEKSPDIPRDKYIQQSQEQHSIIQQSEIRNSSQLNSERTKVAELDLEKSDYMGSTRKNSKDFSEFQDKSKSFTPMKMSSSLLSSASQSRLSSQMQGSLTSSEVNFPPQGQKDQSPKPISKSPLRQRKPSPQTKAQTKQNSPKSQQKPPRGREKVSPLRLNQNQPNKITPNQESKNNFLQQESPMRSSSHHQSEQHLIKEQEFEYSLNKKILKQIVIENGTRDKKYQFQNVSQLMNDIGITDKGLIREFWRILELSTNYDNVAISIVYQVLNILFDSNKYKQSILSGMISDVLQSEYMKYTSSSDSLAFESNRISQNHGSIKKMLEVFQSQIPNIVTLPQNSELFEYIKGDTSERSQIASKVKLQFNNDDTEIEDTKRKQSERKFDKKTQAVSKESFGFQEKQLREGSHDKKNIKIDKLFTQEECSFQPKLNKHSQQIVQQQRCKSQQKLEQQSLSPMRSAINKVQESKQSNKPSNMSPISQKNQKQGQQRRKPNEKPLLYVDINISKGNTQSLSIFQGEDPQIVAETFAAAHQLSDKARYRLVSKLTNLLQQFHQNNKQ